VDATEWLGDVAAARIRRAGSRALVVSRGTLLAAVHQCVKSCGCASNVPVSPSRDCASPSAPRLDDPTYLQINHLSHDQLRVLWHQRLGHMHSRRCSELYKHVHGVPKLDLTTELDRCPVSAQAKGSTQRRFTSRYRLQAGDFCGFCLHGSTLEGLCAIPAPKRLEW
jgi:hypothetical protein